MDVNTEVTEREDRVSNRTAGDKIHSKRFVRRNCPLFALGHNTNPTAISTCDMSTDFRQIVKVTGEMAKHGPLSPAQFSRTEWSH
jgi:hypothetical protein